MFPPAFWALTYVFVGLGGSETFRIPGSVLPPSELVSVWIETPEDSPGIASPIMFRLLFQPRLAPLIYLAPRIMPRFTETVDCLGGLEQLGMVIWPRPLR